MKRSAEPVVAFDAGPLVQGARTDAGLTQAELARRAGTSQAAVSDIERGRRQPTVVLLDRLLRACGRRVTTAAIPEVDPHDLQLLRQNALLTPDRRLANMARIMKLKGLARR